jgi:hypothetical protein
MKKLKYLICKFLIGHKFGGYEIKKDQKEIFLQIIPNEFYCDRCNKVCHVNEGWN